MLSPISPDESVSAILIILGLLISFWGRQIARILSSITFGVIMGYIVFFYSLKLWGSITLSLISAFIAMFIGFTIGFFMFRIALSIVFAYIFTSVLVLDGEILFLLLFILLATMLYLLSKYVIAFLFTLTGTTMIYKGITTLGLNSVSALILCAAVFVLGLYNQTKRKM